MTIAPTAEQLFAQALALHGGGQLAEAVSAYRQVLGLRPEAAAVLVNLGIALQGLNRLNEAEAALRQATIALPDLAEAQNSLGCVLGALGRPSEAEAALRRAIALKPADPEPHNNLGNLLEAVGQWEQAAACYRQAIALAPERAQPLSNLGAVLVKLHRPQEAIHACQAALRLAPNNAEAANNLGNAWLEAGQEAEAEAAFTRASGLPQAATNLAALLYDQERFAEAVALLDQTIAAHPGYAEAHNTLGNSRLALNRLEDAEAALRQAVALAPDNAQFHFNLSAALLKQGRFAEGWREYDWRRRCPGNPLGRIDYLQPHWAGEPLDGRTLLLYGEQGLGDTLQFCRYAALAAALDGRVVLQAQAPLLRLLRSLPGGVEVIGFDAPLPAFDCHLPLMSVPALLEDRASIPYLRADPAGWTGRLAALPGLKVGLAWAGDPRPYNKIAHRLDSRRSLRLEQLAPLAKLGGVSWISLQKGSPAAQTLPPGLVLHDWMDEMTDMADTAALVAALDLVVAVDTSIAHLAGALGKPVWILSRFDGCWRWLHDRDDSPSYPTARLFRQPRPGDWEAVVVRLGAALSRGDYSSPPPGGARPQRQQPGRP
jgi:Flp pilus assembly protein TadD